VTKRISATGVFTRVTKRIEAKPKNWGGTKPLIGQTNQPTSMRSPTVLSNAIDELNFIVCQTATEWYARLAVREFFNSLKKKRIGVGNLMLMIDNLPEEEGDWEDEEEGEADEGGGGWSNNRKNSSRRARTRKNRAKKRKKGGRKRGVFPGTRSEGEQFMNVEVDEDDDDERGEKDLIKGAMEQIWSQCGTGKNLLKRHGEGEGEEEEEAEEEEKFKQKVKTRGTAMPDLGQESESKGEGEGEQALNEGEGDEGVEGEGEDEADSGKKPKKRRTVEQILVAKGFKIVRKKNHVIWKRRREGRNKETVTMSKTPSDHRAEKNQRAMLKRME